MGFIDRQFISEPVVPTSSFNGQTIIVTGANSGLGLEASRMLIKLGALRVILACRNLDKGKTAAKDIQTTTGCSNETLDVWSLDMSNYASVLSFADRAKSELPRLDAMILNAGLYVHKYRLQEGNEEIINTNVISTALLAFLLHPKLQQTATQYHISTHLTITGSELYEVAKFKEAKVPNRQIFETLNDEEVFDKNKYDRYNVSKLLVMFVLKELSALAPVEKTGVVVDVVAPG